MAQLVTKDAIEIRATPERVWRVLTDPELTPRYMFGCRTVSEWKVGSPLLWEGTFDGKTLVAVKGAIEALERPRHLRYSVFDPNGQYTDAPWNYLHVDYLLTPTGDGVRLEVVQGDYATVQDGQKRYQDTVNGWGSILAQIKAIAEEEPEEQPQ